LLKPAKTVLNLHKYLRSI